MKGQVPMNYWLRKQKKKQEGRSLNAMHIYANSAFEIWKELEQMGERQWDFAGLLTSLPVESFWKDA